MSIALEDLNLLDRDAFVGAIGNAFEHSSWIAERSWPLRPFESLSALHRGLCATIVEATREEQLELIRAHPDLVGRAARAGTLTAASTGEQTDAGLDALSAEEIALFDDYNESYRATFGFPFVICARENKKASILAAFPARLGHLRDEEIETALAEIAKIAWFRLQDAVSNPSPK